jgi:ABC-2 type transport system permease protein
MRRHLGGLRALPTLLRIGFTEAIAYRAELVVWVFATTMPLIMMMLWTAVTEVAPIVSGAGRSWSSSSFVAYFLTVFIVRQLISSWAAWEINFEVRQGLLAMRLLRPIHPIVSYLVQNLAALPMRLVVSAPVVLVLLVGASRAHLETRPVLWLVWAGSMLGGWLITFFANIFIGALSLFMESSVKVMDVWLAAFFVFSGYLFPLDMFPPWLRTASDFLPFRYQIGLPVELATGALDVSAALPLLLRQWGWALGLFTASLLVWRAGIRRYQAFGG